MLPHQLTLKNFMSYGDEPTTIDLRGMNVVCLSGDNGHGKSALLDAVTWALWGETRLGRQNHEQLIRLGADEMSVVLEFGEGGSVYRVRRQRSKRSGSQLWEAQILEEGGTWRSITGQGSGDTGRVIVQLLRMSYETFLNSAYLRQGRADEFVRQTANKRKDILAEILDLSRYDVLELKARAKMREAADRALDANREIQQIDSELSQEQATRDFLAVVEAQLAELSVRQAEAQQHSDELSAARGALMAEREQLRKSQQQIESLNAQVKRIELTITTEGTAIERAGALIRDKEQIKKRYARYGQAQSEVEALLVGAQRLRELERRRLELQNRITSEQREIEIRLKSFEDRHKETLMALSILPGLKTQIRTGEDSEAEYRALVERRQAVWEEQKRLTSRFAEMKATKTRADQDLAEAQDRLQKISTQGEACSICGSALPPEKLEHLYQECLERINALTLAVKGLKNQGRQSLAARQSADGELTATEAGMKRLEADRDRLSVLLHRVRELEATQRDILPDIAAKIGATSDQLQREQFAVAERSELSMLMPEIESLAFMEKQLDATNREIAALRPVERQHVELQAAGREMESAVQRLTEAQETLKDLDMQRELHMQSLLRSPAVERQIMENSRDTDGCRAAIRRMADECQRTQREQGRLLHLVERAEKIRLLRVELDKTHQAAKDDEELYAALAGSFSKRGVQALIIENALPEFQEDADELLKRLTDGQMTVSIQTTRLGKGKTAGDAPIETLDVVIGDELGSRPLEMYSGGESFRVSFALRIALSKLLTRRAGASLQTLIIDEGFGTQDAKGREKLVDAIMAIQADFAQIIVITHVDELKDAFPNRIEVVKTPTGSEVTVIGGAALG